MDFIPHTDLEIREMLASVGAAGFDDLLKDIPREFRAKPMCLPAPLAEQELRRALNELAQKNCQHSRCQMYLGAGAYDHFVPSAIHPLASRGEFLTAYTPYQPEVSQGTLHAIYEYQSMICELTGMDVSNASLYDGATAAAEAMLMCLGEKVSARRVLVSASLHPEWRAVLRTYAKNLDVVVEEVSCTGGVTDVTALKKALASPAACFIVSHPNFFGCLEPLAQSAQAVHDAGALFVVGAYPISLGLLNPPSEFGADVVVGEGQCLGSPLMFGGPYLGIFACRDSLKRRLPGRVVGQTVDKNGKRGFVLTMQAREQHIRREKATSNICTNQSLVALTAAMYLTCMGKEGFRQVACCNAQRAGELYDGLTGIKGVHAAFDRPFFNEFTVVLDKPVGAVQKALMEEKFIAGLDLEKYYPLMKNHLLLCATETKTSDNVQAFVAAFKKVMAAA